MSKTVKEIAQLINGAVAGDGSIIIKGVSGIKEAREGDITFLANPKYFPFIDKTRASAIIAPKGVESAVKTLIRVDNPSLAFVKVVSILSPQEVKHPKGIHPSAVIGNDVSLGKNVSLGPYVVVEEGVTIGENCVIYSGTFIGRKTKIGADSLIYANVSIREDVNIGSRAIIHSGTVIGSDGFGFVTVEGKHQKVPQAGGVEIGDDVEIGANVTIDRARFDKTIIGSGSKIDNLVQIAHNVVVGENSLIVAQAGISGSTIIGKGAILAGQSGLAGHLNVGDGAVIAAQAGVTKSVPANTIVSGYPARPHEEAKRINAYVQNLPKMHEEMVKLKKKVQELEAKLKEK